MCLKNICSLAWPFMRKNYSLFEPFQYLLQWLAVSQTCSIFSYKLISIIMFWELGFSAKENSSRRR